MPGGTDSHRFGRGCVSRSSARSRASEGGAVLPAGRDPSVGRSIRRVGAGVFRSAVRAFGGFARKETETRSVDEVAHWLVVERRAQARASGAWIVDAAP